MGMAIAATSVKSVGPRTCDHAHRQFANLEPDVHDWDLGAAVETYLWEGSLFDCSIGESVSATAPSSFVRSHAHLSLDDSGPSWCNDAGDVVFTNLRGESNRPVAFIVRASWLQGFLVGNDLELMIASWHERRYLDRDDRRRSTSEEIHAAARVDSELRIQLADEIRERR
jgi:hypothetical protein